MKINLEDSLNEMKVNYYKVRVTNIFEKYNTPELVDELKIMNNWISFEEEINSLVDLDVEGQKIPKNYKNDLKQILLNLGKELMRETYPNSSIRLD